MKKRTATSNQVAVAPVNQENEQIESQAGQTGYGDWGGYRAFGHHDHHDHHFHHGGWGWVAPFAAGLAVPYLLGTAGGYPPYPYEWYPAAYPYVPGYPFGGAPYPGYPAPGYPTAGYPGYPGYPYSSTTVTAPLGTTVTATTP